jgi:uncharacterized protein
MAALGCICIFVKPPVLGTVKTRLAATLGMDGATALARAFLRDTWEQMQRIPWAHAVIATTEEPPPGVLPSPAETWLQGEGDLGARIARILSKALSTFPFAMALGADTPGLPNALLETARDWLAAGSTAVVGPSDDGGFYLLGLRSCWPGLLDTLSWSTERTCAETVERLSQHGLNPKMLSPWFDVDDAASLDRLVKLIREGEICATETQRVLSTLSLLPLP